ncbi:MAG: thiamine diphosphokinase [Clostridiales bacterium]|nr:thiamine diphosphokinase [Clostridiales bacterium]
MKGILLLNGTPYGGKIDCENAFVVCCDGAYRWARGKVKIDENVGDFDSLDFVPDPPPSEIYPSEKDFTDGEIALFKLLAKGVDEVEIYGGFGGRYDHFMGNLHLLYAAFSRGIAAKMIDKNTVAFLGGGKIDLSGNRGKTFSLLPFGGVVHIMESKGCKYAYPEKIGYGECRGISNIAESDTAYVTVGDNDCALIFVNRGEV